MARILIGSPVRQTPSILKEFLDSLKGLDREGFQVSYYLIDDNDNPASSSMLTAFASSASCIVRPGADSASTYRRDDATHYWPEEAVWRVAAYKDLMIEHAVDAKYDGLFLVDSDLVLHPQTLKQLWSAQADIISEIFWTRWQPGQPALPQVWQSGSYSLTPEFIEQLRGYGVFPVGGLGACTLIRSAAMNAGVRFHKVAGLDMWGEDRHFCARAKSLGIDLYVDTHYPAYHIYREPELVGLPKYRAAYEDRQLEVRMVQSARTTLEAWGTSDWRTITGLEGLDGFAGDLKQAELNRAAEKVEAARRRHTTAATAVLTAKVKAFDRTAGVGQIEMRVINEGIDGEQRFLDLLRADLTMAFQDGKWLVVDMQFSPEDGSSAVLQELCDAYLQGRAKALVRSGMPGEAMTLLLRHWDRIEKNPDLLVVLIEALTAQGRYTEARKILLDVLPTVPDHTGLLCELARICEIGEYNTTFDSVVHLLRRLGSPTGLAYAESAAERRKQKNAPGVLIQSKKRIALLYDSPSGSNTLAFYKLTPAHLRERYELDVIPNASDYLTQLRVADHDLAITTHGYPPLDPKQLNLELWHGFPFEATGLMDRQESHPAPAGHWRHTDKIASYSPLFNTVMNACIGKTIDHYVITGAPRNDFLFVCDGRENLSRVLGEPIGSRRVVLFMPALRNRLGTTADSMDQLSVLRSLGIGTAAFSRLLREQNILLLLKLHPAEEQRAVSELGIGRSSPIRLLRTEYLLENGLDLYEVLNAVDVLVTDYASVYFDFLLLNRPVIFTVVDCEADRKKRGFLLEPYSSWTAGPAVADQASFEAALLTCLSDPDAYGSDRIRILRLVHQYPDGASTERVWHVVEEMVGAGIGC